MDEVEVESTTETVGERLRAAREAKGLTVEEIAASTRIPTRHLESLEASDWERLPAPTYSIGFAKNYAAAVGLDRTEIGEQLRTEMGGTRPTYQPPVDLFEPADPKRVMPKGLVLGALAALLVVILGLTWLSNRELSGDDEVAPAENAAAPAPAAPVVAAAPPVVITANQAAWIEVRDGAAILKQGELAVGESFEVPANAVAPTLTTAKPEALRISVGTADAPMIGTPGTKVENVSLKGEDLMKGPQPAPAAAATQPPPVTLAPPPVRRAPATTTRRSAPAPTTAAPAPAAAEPAPPPAPVTNTTTP